MRLAKLVGERFKEKPSDCLVESHSLMVRGGYIKNIASGIYSSYMPLKRITRKIEEIIRQEMDKIDGQEVSFPVVLPASLWEESGRYESVGSELLRFVDRNGSKCVLGMTHEEASVNLVREYGNSYLKYPFMIYQVQTKFRDEARPRGGLIRVREFTMKDGYSFHTSNEDLSEYYYKCHTAYENIFRRVGIPQVVSVLSDSGMMGGSLSHEFMLLTPIGEDTIVTCNCCDFKANMEAAKNTVINDDKDDSLPITLVNTPNCKTIEEVCGYLKTDEAHSCKAVVYQKQTDDEIVVLFIRGDYEVNEAKLKNYLKSDIYPAIIDETTDLQAGFIGPYELNTKHTVVFDSSLKDAKNLICGGNKEDYHYTGMDMLRDIGEVDFVDVAKIKDGGICPKCGKETISISRGIEVGNIFQLGNKYTKAMNMTYLDSDGETKYPVMGCYGIGVGRLAASVCEVKRDDYGPIWPISIAPWQVHICVLRADDEAVKKVAEDIYETLTKKGVEVIIDDRAVSAGVMFSDADLLGVPVRIVVSPRNLKENVCEVSARDKSFNEKVAVNECANRVYDIVMEHLINM